MSKKRESDFQVDALLALSNDGCTVWRQNTGMGWSGEPSRMSGGYVLIHPSGRKEFLSNTDMLVRYARPLHCGLCVGSSDIIGFKPITVTEDMVGDTIARFIAVECKAPRGKVDSKQANFINHVNSNGGVAVIAKSIKDLPL